ncbi:hypothetical protein ACHAXN_008239 [Cyclotella atomus]
MFGVSRKKKSSKQSQLLSFADDDEDEPPTEERKRKRKDKKKSTMLSFDPDDDADEINDVGKKRKKRDKKKKSGMGYGGMMLHDDDDVQFDHEEARDAISSYDTVALEKLRMEQKRRKETDVPKDNVRVEQKEQQQQQRILDSSDKEEEYISLSGNKSNSDPVVLTGDDAFAYAQDDEPVEFDHGLEQPQPSTTKPSPMDIDDTKLNEAPNEDMEEDNRQWEDNMARRAGVLPPPSSFDSTKKETRLSPLASLAQIRSSLQPTISNLQNISLDLETAIHRHESNLSSTRDDLTKHQSTLEGHGDALEYYQLLRAELADWMGALRQVKGMVDSVHDARCNWESNVTLTRYQRGYEWSEDVRDVLRRKGLVDQVIGDVDDAPIEDVGVDEFGRDLSSMATMARTKRWEVRRRNFANAGSTGERMLTLQETMKCLHSDNISAGEVADWKQRGQALKEAITIITSIVSDDYLSVSNLCNLFFQWQDKYPEDYKSFYAEMTLVSMVSVLAELEMFQRWGGLVDAEVLDNIHEPGIQLNDVADFKWLQDLKQAAKNRSIEATDSSKLMNGVLEKCTESYLLRYMSVDSVVSEANDKHGLYDPISASETKWLCKAIHSLLAEYTSINADLAKSLLTKVATSLLSLLKYNVAKRATLIVNTNELVMQNDGYEMRNSNKFDGETIDSISYAIYSQANELSMLATNVLTHWCPMINSSLELDSTTASIIDFVLMEVISLRILPVIHTFQSICETCRGEEKQSFHDLQQSIFSTLFSAVRNAGLLEKEEWKLCTDLLRSAAQTIGLDVDDKLK